MNSHASDPNIDALANEVKRGIRVALENHCYVDAAILIYSGIDSMAYLAMPETQEDVSRQDFVDWCDLYIQPPHPDSPTSLELYAARCGVVHSHSAASRLFRDGKARLIFYMSETEIPVRYDTKIDETIVLLSVPALSQWFFEGLDQFTADLCGNPERARIANDRLDNILHTARRGG